MGLVATVLRHFATVVVATREEAVAMRCGQRIVLGRLGTNSSKPDA
jgi:hypothetical protein